MDSRTRLTLAVGAAAGYAVGRSKKEKVALGLLSLVTGRATDPMSLIGQSIRKFAETPQFEQLSGSLTSVLEQRTRSLLDTEAEGDSRGRASTADADVAGETGDGEYAHEDTPGDDEPKEPQEEKAEPSEPSQIRRARPKKAASTSVHRAGPKNPPAAKAKAVGRKARAERATRRPGPKNPPAAKAMARKAADQQAASRGEPGKKPPADRSR